MMPPGRRRGAGLSSLAALITLFLFIIEAAAASSVLGLDFGTLNIKAALVKPGIPLEIVLSKDSKRKETAAVAFKPSRDSKNNIIAEAGTFPERLYGGDALALQGRIPGEVFPNLKPLLGLPWTETASGAVETYKERYPAVQAVQVREMGTTVVRSAAFVKEEMPWSVEELLAMELSNIRRNAEAMAGKGNLVEDVVITVPAFYTADERYAIERAAGLAGMNVNALISDGLAVGLDYAKSRTFPEVTSGGKPEHHLVFDMGSGSTTATLLRCQGRSVKDVGRFNKTVQEVAVLGTGWDRTLGGDSLNHVVLDDYVHKFLTKPALKSRGTTPEQVKSNARLMSRMWKEVEKARQVLSANTETSSSFEELLPDIDFRVKLSRSDFEDLTTSFADRVTAPINDALAAAKLSIADVDSIILHGGAVRTPFVQRKLEEIAGGTAKLRSNVNADESAVFGAAFKGAGLSPSFKVKEIRDSDIAGYAAGIKFTDSGKERRQGLFGVTSPVGHGATTKQVTFKDKQDFTFSLYQVINDVDRAVTRVETQNLTASVKDLETKFGCTESGISTKFAIRLGPANGLPEVLSGSVSCEVEGTAKSASVGDSVKDWLGLGKKKDQQPLQDGESDEVVEEVNASGASAATASASGPETASSSSTKTSKVPEKPKKRTESISIAFTTGAQGNPQPAPEEMKRMRERLAAFDRSDRARAAREEALNVLEGYTYSVRDFLSNDEYSLVSTPNQRSEISKLLDATRDWMDSSNFAKSTEEILREKLTSLKDLVEPIKARRREDTTRPAKLESLRSALEQTQKLMEMVKGQLASASSAQSEASLTAEAASRASAEAAAAAASSSSSSSSIPEASAAPDVSSPSDDFADLEEPETSSPSQRSGSSTTATPTPRSISLSDFSPYTPADLSSVSDVYASVSAWLDEKAAAQQKLQPHDEPVLLVKDIEAQASKLSDVMTELLYKKLKNAPRSSSASSSSTSKKAKSSSSKTKGPKKGKNSVTSSASSSPFSTSASAQKGKAGGAAAAGNPNIVTVRDGDDMPSEEEILRMVSRAKAGQSSASSAGGSSSGGGADGDGAARAERHDEL